MDTLRSLPARGGLDAARVLAKRASLTPNERFVCVGGEVVSFGAMAVRAEQAAAALRYAGVGSGDRVAVMLPNSLEFLEVWFGSAAIGAVLVPVNTGLRGEGLRHVVEHSGARLLVADGPLIGECESALSPVGGITTFCPRTRRRWEPVRDWLDGGYAQLP